MPKGVYDRKKKSEPAAPRVPTMSIQLGSPQYLRVLDEQGRVLTTLYLTPQGITGFNVDAKLRNHNVVRWNRLFALFNFACCEE